MKKIFNTRKNIILGLLVLSSLGLLVSCRGKKEEAKGAAETAFSVNVLKMAPENMENYIEFGGSVQAVDSVAILPSVAGKVSKILVKVGDKVSRNQVIAQIDPSKPGAEFALSPVKATFSGTLTSLPLSVGAYATTSTTIAQISSTEDLEIKINVSERFVPFIKEGQIAQITFKSYPAEVFEASVHTLSPMLDPATRSMEVTLRLTDTKDIVKAGMFAHVKLITQVKEDVLALPNRSIVYSGGKPFVFISESEGESSVKRVPVETGLSIDGKTEITSGLADGNLVVVKGQNMISDGQKVKALVNQAQ